MMATQTLPFDAAHTLTAPAAQADLLSDAMASGDAGYVANALGIIARARGMTEVTREALSEAGGPRLTTLLGVLKALGFRLSVEAAR